MFEYVDRAPRGSEQTVGNLTNQLKVFSIMKAAACEAASVLARQDEGVPIH
jgi:hypothetical protein